MENVSEKYGGSEHRDQIGPEALESWNEYQRTGLHLTAEEADDWLARLEAGENAEAPKCHI